MDAENANDAKHNENRLELHTQLMRAIQQSNLDEVDDLVSRGAPIQRVLPSEKIPLVSASIIGRVNIVEALLAYGAMERPRGNGQTSKSQSTLRPNLHRNQHQNRRLPPRRWSRKEKTTTTVATASPMTSRRRSNGTARQPRRVTQKGSIDSASATTRDGASPRTTRRRSNGTARQPTRATQTRRTASAAATTMDGASPRTARRQSNGSVRQPTRATRTGRNASASATNMDTASPRTTRRRSNGIAGQPSRATMMLAILQKNNLALIGLARTCRRPVYKTLKDVLCKYCIWKTRPKHAIYTTTRNSTPSAPHEERPLARLDTQMRHVRGLRQLRQHPEEPPQGPED